MQAADLPASQSTARPRVRILVLEDDPSYAALVRHNLAAAAWADPEVEAVETLRGALARLAAPPGIDLVIADLNLPDSRGADTIAALAGACQQPIIAITADDDPDMRVRVMASGAYEFLLKKALDKATLERHTRLAAMQSQALRSLKESEARMRDMSSLSSDWFWETDEQHRFVHTPGRVTELTGMTATAYVGKKRWEVAGLSPVEGDWSAHQAALDRRETYRDLELVQIRADGERVYLQIAGKPIFDAHGVFTGYRGTARDITSRKAQEAALRAKDAQLRLIVDSVSATLSHVDAGERFLYTNRAHAELYGHGGGAVGHTLREVIGETAYRRSTPYRERVLRGEAVTFELIRVDADGVERVRSIHQVPEFDEQGRVVGFYSLGTDITEHKRAEERVRYLAHHDALTGLPNRLLFQDRVNQAIAQAQRTAKKVAVLFIDLDHFKHINDSLGHPIGDLVLQAVARRLLGCLRDGDSVCRLGGDEFVINLPDLAESRSAALVAGKVLEALGKPFDIEGRELHVDGSIGIAVAPDDGGDAAALMSAADTAMYHAKDKGRSNYRFFTTALNEASQQRVTLASQLRHAIARGEFALHYQPQVELATGRIFSVEALLRWQRDGGAPVSCDEFISVAEETGLIVPIGEWALREACSQLQRWRAAGAAELQLAVNLSVRQFYRASFAEVVAQALAATGLPAAALELEITESVLLVQSQENLAALQRLADMGVRLSVDDFGTGYSSLAYLQRFPLHALKIDRSFVAGIGHDSSHTAIVTAIIAMAKSLRLTVVAEGVEEATQAAFLRERGCHAAQGYFYGRPMSAEALGERLATASPARANPSPSRTRD